MLPSQAIVISTETFRSEAHLGVWCPLRDCHRPTTTKAIATAVLQAVWGLASIPRQPVIDARCSSCSLNITGVRSVRRILATRPSSEMLTRTQSPVFSSQPNLEVLWSIASASCPLRWNKSPGLAVLSNTVDTGFRESHYLPRGVHSCIFSIVLLVFQFCHFRGSWESGLFQLLHAAQ